LQEEKMTDSNYSTGEDNILTSYDSDNSLINNQNQEISPTSNIFNLGDGDVFNEDSLSLFDLESVGATTDDKLTGSYTGTNQDSLFDDEESVEATTSNLAGSYTDTVGTSSATSNNLGVGYGNQDILTTSRPESGYKNNWGTPEEDAPYWRRQEGKMSCALVAQISIYESITGEYVSESAIAEYAENQGWFDQLTGTPLEYTGSVLNAYGIETEQYWDNYDGNNYDVNLDTIGAALNNGDKVIAALDGNEIWNPSYNTSTRRPYEQTDTGDVAHQDYDHAVWVTGIEQYSDNTWNIILNDSGTDSGQSEAVNYWDFMNAWDDSNNFLSVVDA
jgi:hypothetical protein